MWGPLTQVLEERKKRIADGLAAAERGHHEKELGKRRAIEVIREAREAAAEMMTQAQSRSRDIVEEAEDEAKASAERIMTAAKIEIEQEVSRAKEQLRAQIAILAVSGAERILRKEIDAKDHAQMLTTLAANL
ncbi:ATP synthase Fo complex subunit b [Gammaproteobacteria bacterium]